MALTLVGSATVAGTTIAIPAHQAGDFIVIFAYRNGSNTLPGIPSGWNDDATNASNTTNTGRVGSRVATSSGTVSGTWTSATRLAVQVWRGALGYGGSFAAPQMRSSGSSSRISFSVSSTFGAVGSKWALFGAHRTATNLNAPFITGNSDGQNYGLKSYLTTVPQIAVWTTDGVPSGSGTNQDVNATSGWVSAGYEVLADPNYVDPGSGKKIIVGVETAANRYKGVNRPARYVGTATDWV